MSQSCTRCGLSCYLARDEAANGSTQIFWWCAGCWNVADARHPFVRKEYAVNVLRRSVESLPIVERYPAAPKPACVVCGQVGAEYHHWAPKHLFDDAELWPGAYLCGTHHAEWHAKVTPHMTARINGKKTVRTVGKRA